METPRAKRALRRGVQERRVALVRRGGLVIRRLRVELAAGAIHFHAFGVDDALAVTRVPTLDGDLVARLERRLLPSALRERIRTAELHFPLFHFAVVGLAFDRQERMRVGPVDLD